MRQVLPWLLTVAVWPAAAQSRITVTLYDQAGLVQKHREAMKNETSRIFEEAGVELDWVDCEIEDKPVPVNLAVCSQPVGSSRLMLLLAPGNNKKTPTAAGMAVIQENASVYACLYPSRVQELARDANWRYGELLGHAAAHELGHLLLRSSAHTDAGIMRARWEVEDLRKLTHAGLVFLPGQLRRADAAGGLR